MQNTSEIWDSLAAEVNTRIEARATINGVTYTDIEPPVITRSLMQQGCSVGNVVSAMCALTLDTSNTIPKSASVFMEMRLVGGTEDEPVTSEWLPVGTFYVSNRKKYPQTTITDFVCYDALLKANAVWEPESSVWPQQSSAIASEIAENIGLTFDSRTSITSYDMSQPDAGTTMRDVLGIIAQQNGGNWIVTPENKLRLVPIIDLGDSEESEEIVEINAVIDDYYIEDEKTITGVRYQVDDAYALLGNDNGIVIDVTIPGIIAGYLYDAINGYTYRPFTFGAAYYNPAIELGDFINYGGDISILCSEEITLGPYATGDISAPDVDEMGDEYPYVGSSEKVLYAAKSYAEIVADAARDEAIDAAAADLADAVLEINSDIEDLQDQIDGNITTWFYSVDPTLSNPPASNWTTTAEKNNHLGDLYYNTTNGYCWRFMLSNDVYSWSRITDTDIATALAKAQHAQDTADGKRRVFVVQPTPPYDVGDLWVEGSSGDIKKCVTAKAEGASYAAADWALASKYTDDTAVSTLNNSLNQQEIFNRLTDNGAAQGVVLYNGQLYINAGYINAGYLSAARIKGDTLTLGGDNNVNGVLRVLDANGNVITTLNNSGADIVNGSITTYSTDQQTRTILSDGILKFQFYNSAAQPIGWRDALRLVADSQSATIGTFAGIAELDISGRGRVKIKNSEGTTDPDYAEIDMDDDSVLLTATRNDSGMVVWTSLQVTKDGVTVSKKGTIGDPYVLFELAAGQSSKPLSIGNGGTGATTPAGARANLDVPSTTGSGASGTWGISITGNAATATKATQDGSGNNIVSRYLPYNTAGGIATCEGEGQNWYYKIATIEIANAYINRPIVFEISGRGFDFSLLQVMFVSGNTLDPGLNSFTTNGNALFWIKKTATSTWEIYGKYNETYGSACIHRITGMGADIGVTVNMTNAGTSDSIISGATQANIVAVPMSGVSTNNPITGNLYVKKGGDTFVEVTNTNTGARCLLDSDVAYHGIWSNGYWNGSSLVTDGKWMLYRDSNGKIIFNDTLGVDHGGTGATTAAGARTNLGITPANIGAVDKSGDTMTGDLTVQSSAITLSDVDKGNLSVHMHISGSGDSGIYSNGYYNGSSFIASGKWLVHRDTNDVIRLGNAVPVDNGGTGATTPAGARANLGAATTQVISSGSLHDIKTSGLYYLTGAVTDKPVGNGGFYSVCAYSNALIVGKYISFSNEEYNVVYVNDTWYYYNVPSATGSGASGTWGISITGSAGKIAITETSIQTDANGYVSIPNATLNPLNHIIDYAYVNTAGIAVIIGCGSNGANYRFLLYTAGDTMTRYKAVTTVYFGYHHK